jgi:hypothetical protein
MNVLTRDVHLMKAVNIGEFRNRGGDFGMPVILCSAAGDSSDTDRIAAAEA